MPHCLVVQDLPYANCSDFIDPAFSVVTHVTIWHRDKGQNMTYIFAG